jgi:maleate cis-trans isomerase
MYGWRGRVGLVSPSRGETLHYEFCKVAPEGVIPVGTALGVQRLVADELGAILDRYEAAVREMVYEECDVIQLGGTPPVTSGVPGTEERLLERARAVASVPIFTGVQAEIEAMRAVGARRVAVGTPYTEALTAKFQAYFQQAGFEIPVAYGLGIERNVELSKLPLHAAYRVAREVYERADGAVDAVHLTCPRWATITVLERLEQDLGVPVTSSSQATIYGALARLRIHDRIDGYGSLLARLGRRSAVSDQRSAVSYEMAAGY